MTTAPKTAFATGKEIVAPLATINPGYHTMRSEHFDLNDIQHEPTDAQLKTLMNSVALEAKRRAELARLALMQRLRDDIHAANQPRSEA